MDEDNILELIGEDDATNCFARIDCTHCNALIKKECKDCPFFKYRSEIKNNPYYGYSYDNPEKHKADMKKYKIDPDDVIY